MSHLLSEKAISLLRFIEGNAWDRDYEVWEERWSRLCERWGEKVARRKLEELVERGYVAYGGGGMRHGWLTEKGKTALAAATLPEVAV